MNKKEKAEGERGRREGKGIGEDKGERKGVHTTPPTTINSPRTSRKISAQKGALPKYGNLFARPATLT